MIFDCKRYECKTFAPNKRDYTEYTFYSSKDKREVKIMGDNLSCNIPPSGVLKVGKKITIDGNDLLFISSDFDIDGFNNHRDKYREEEALMFKVFIKDALEQNELEDNEFSRYLVRRLMRIHGGPVFKAWEDMADYAEIYNAAEEFFSRMAGSEND